MDYVYCLLGCFTAAVIPSEGYLPENIRKQLLIASIILGIFHLTFEIRQFIYDPIKWIIDPWNYLGKNKFICLSIELLLIYIMLF